MIEESVNELRQRVNKLERQTEFLLKALNLQYVDQPTQGIDPAIAELVHKGKLIDAIKRYREQTGADLVTAKKFIESLE